MSWNRLLQRHCKSAEQGQNLIELALTFPIFLLISFFIIELGRVWFVYEGAKMAANEGAHAAATYHNPQVGKNLLDKKLAAASLDVQEATVQQIPNRHAYQANVKVRYTPLFSNLSISVLGGKSISILPAGFDIEYQAVDDVSLY